MTGAEAILYKTFMMEEIFYSSVVELCREERYKMYMECTKDELARMLVERDMSDSAVPEHEPVPLDRRGMICRSWKDCTNPQRDCMDCPLRYKSGDRSYASYRIHIPETPPEGIWY